MRPRPRWCGRALIRHGCGVELRMFFDEFYHRWRVVVPKSIVLVYSVAVFLLTMAMPTSALAQMETNRATARNLAAEGYAALKIDDFALAEDRFRRADSLVHAPTLVVDHARALIGLGRFVEAQERLELVLREGVADNASLVWKRSLQDAQQLVQLVAPKVGWLTITVKGPREPRVAVDGVQVPVAALGVRRATDPGSRRISATASDYIPTEVTVSMPEGGERAVTLKLKFHPSSLIPSALAPQPQLRSQPQPAVLRESHQPSKRSSDTVGYAVLGLGGAGLVVGTVTGIIFLRKHSDLASKCPNTSNCQQQGLIDEYNRYGTISGISLGIGLASSVAGLWLLLSNNGDAETHARPKHVAVIPYVSNDHLGLMGSF
jgi:hypothetical protein